MSSLDKISVKTSDVPKLKNPKLICGLPGSGYVGKLAVDYMLDKLKAKEFVEIHSSSFPPQVSIQPDGTVDLVKNTISFCKLKNKDLVILSGDAQPVSAQGEYLLAEEIIRICKKVGVHEIFTLAAYITGKFSKIPKVYGTATSIDSVKAFSQYEILPMDRGNITGMNGVLIGMAKRSSISGICLLGETSGYVIDAKASKAVLESLCKILDIQFDMSELDQRAKDTEELIKAIQSQSPGQAPSDQLMQLSQPSDEKSLGYIS